MESREKARHLALFVEEKAMKVWMAARLGVAVAGLLIAGSALAQGPGGEQGAMGGPGFGGHRPPMERALGPQGNQGRWWNNPKMVEELKLTDEQRKAMDAILFQHREKLVDLRGAVEKAELEMEPLMRDDQPNEAKILAQIDKVAQARAELEKANARFLMAIRGQLKPEQWKQVQAIRANREQRQRDWERGGQRHDREGPGGEGPGGQFHRQAPPSMPAPPTPTSPTPPAQQ
jgi:Spy/CpxP family protein refolding chaperone